MLKKLKFLKSSKIWLSFLLAVFILVVGYMLLFSWLNAYTEHGKEIEVPNINQMPIAQAIALLEERNLEYEIDSFKFEPKYKPLHVISVYPEPGSKVKRGRKIFVRSNPKTWAPVEVPNLIDRSKFAAFSYLKILGLKVGDTIYEPSISKDRVLRMIYKGKTIAPGTKVPKFSTLDLVIGEGLSKDVLAPDLQGLTLAQARKILKENYFEVGLIQFSGKPDSANARVFFQDPAPNSTYDQGLLFNLWLSTKPISELSAEIAELNKRYRAAVSLEEIERNLSPEEKKKIEELKKKKAQNTLKENKTGGGGIIIE